MLGRQYNSKVNNKEITSLSACVVKLYHRRSAIPSNPATREFKLVLRSTTWPDSYHAPYYSVSNHPFRTRPCDRHFLPAHVPREQWLHGIKPVALSVHRE
jgi:hypothetical protein